MLMILMTVMVVGALATRLIPVQMLPSGFSENWLWLQIPYADASPQEVDEAIVGPVYSELSSIEGIERIRSRAGSFGAGFFIQLAGNTDSSVAYNAVIDRVERALVKLPDDVEDYRVYKYDPNDTPIAWIGVELPQDLDDPHWVIAEVLQPRLERIPGVANVKFWGTGETLVSIEYDQERVMAHGIDLRELQARLRADNFQMPAGEVVEEGRTLLVRSQSRFAGLQTLRQIPVAAGLTLSDIATVGWKRQGEDETWRINGAKAVTLGVFKESQANTLEVDEQLQQAFRDLEDDKRFTGLRFHTFFSQGELLREGI
ncbi:MAG TPA: efflux RND transporter permease subunit, partial [Candidatus Handelsmanbacteria bacterium]|nr:efflux RND transporter permease subunit [Candidatus Handelsmanbacteria bacterium]